MSTLSACDNFVAEPPTPEPEVVRGTFTARLNGQPWTAPVNYFASTVQPDLFSLIARRSGPPPNYYNQHLSFTYRGPGFVEGQTLPLSRPDTSSIVGRFPHVILSESFGDGVTQTFWPLEGAAGAFRIVEVDSSANRLRATFETTLVGTSSRTRYQQLPDTLHFTEGIIETELFPVAN